MSRVRRGQKGVRRVKFYCTGRGTHREIDRGEWELPNELTAVPTDRPKYHGESHAEALRWLVAYKRAHPYAESLGGDGPCPECGNDLKLNEANTWRLVAGVVQAQRDADSSRRWVRLDQSMLDIGNRVVDSRSTTDP